MENHKEADSKLEEREKEQPKDEHTEDTASVVADDESKDEETTDEQESDEPDLEQELAESRDKFLRLYSEFENFRRRTAREKIELVGTASKELMMSLLPVLDDFERALKIEGKHSTDNQGLELIYNKLTKIFEGKGLKKMKLKPGDDFDPEFHEAITQIPAPKKKLEGKIVDVIEPGYYLNEKVIRFAKVVTGAKS